MSTSTCNTFIIIAGLALVALVSGTSNIISFPLDMLMVNFDLSRSQAATFTTLGFIGVYFTLPAGMLLDRFGPLMLTMVSGVVVSVAYLIMSFMPQENYFVVVLLYVLVGFGSGATFLCALGTVIKMSPTGDGLGVAVVSAAMSLSVALTLNMSKWMLPLFDINDTFCEEIDGNFQSFCWRVVFRIWSAETAIGMILGSVVLIFYKQKSNENSELGDGTAVEVTVEKNGLYYVRLLGIDIFTHYYYYVLIFVYYIGIGSGIFILVSTFAIWEEFTASQPEIENLALTFLTSFSFVNAGMGFFGGSLSTFLKKKNILTHYGFLAVVMIIGGLDFMALGAFLWLEKTQTFHIGWFYGVLMAIQGMTFGASLFVVPVLTADIYGFQDFGTFFAWVQLGSSAAALTYPHIISAVSFSSFISMFFISGGACLLASILLIVMPRSQFSRKAAGYHKIN